MYKQEKIKPYDADSSKSEQVEQMFDNIAHSYDQLNHFLSLGIDKRWRRAAIKQLRSFEPKEILDVATGTGDFAILSTRSLCPNQVVGIDISEGMLKVARQKVAAAGLSEKVQFKKEDCLKLSFEENSFDAVQVAYGVRNFEDLDKGLSEMFRVLKPGGHAVIVELSSPRRFPMRQLFQLYARVLMPEGLQLFAGIYGSCASRARYAKDNGKGRFQARVFQILYLWFEYDVCGRKVMRANKFMA